MSKVRTLFVGVLMAAALMLGSPAYAQMCGAPQVSPLVAGQHYPAGTVSVYNDSTFLYVTYTLGSPWVMSEAHVAAAGTLAGIAQTKSGNPIPGRFQYNASFDQPVTRHAVVIPLASLTSSGQVIVAAHAAVQAPRSAGGSQTAWGFGYGFPGANWAMYMTYNLQSCWVE